MVPSFSIHPTKFRLLLTKYSQDTLYQLVVQNNTAHYITINKNEPIAIIDTSWRLGFLKKYLCMANTNYFHQ